MEGEPGAPLVSSPGMRGRVASVGKLGVGKVLQGGRLQMETSSDDICFIP